MAPAAEALLRRLARAGFLEKLNKLDVFLKHVVAHPADHELVLHVLVVVLGKVLLRLAARALAPSAHAGPGSAGLITMSVGPRGRGLAARQARRRAL